MRRNWEPILLRAAIIVRAYDGVLTLRGLFYRLLSEGLIRNSQSDYTQLSSLTAKARREGWFPDLLDRTRRISLWQHWNNPVHAYRSMADSYRLDRTRGQVNNVFLGVEKEAMLGALEAWYSQRHYPFLALKGYSSQTLADQVRRYVNSDERPSILIYAGDLDPSGTDIDRSFIERANCFDVVVRIAVKYEHIAQYGLVKQPGKWTDSRAEGFVERYGSLFQVELEALAPTDLKAMFDAELEDLWDEDVFNAVIEQEREERAMLGRGFPRLPNNPWRNK
jgi:hypothetical protein